MPANPSRRGQGGDVPGTEKTDVMFAVGSPIDVATASYQPGYPISRVMGDVTYADLKQGFCSYGRAVGDAGTFMDLKRGGKPLEYGGDFDDEYDWQG